MICHVLFDFDGTIVDSLGVASELLEELARKYGREPVSTQELQKLKYAPVPQQLKQLGVPVHRIPSLALECAQRYRQAIPRLQPVEGMGELLHTLKKAGLDLSVFSSNPQENIQTFLRKNGMEVFDQIHSSYHLFGKEQALEAFLRRCAVPKEQLLYVGDELRDVTACKKLGVKVVAAAWGYDPLPLLESGSPDFIAAKPAQVLAAVNSL